MDLVLDDELLEGVPTQTGISLDNDDVYYFYFREMMSMLTSM